MGWKSKFTSEERTLIKTRLLARVEAGEHIRDVLDEPGWPPLTTVRGWMNQGFDPWSAAMCRAGAVNLRRLR
jgi:hypothetical protein